MVIAGLKSGKIKPKSTIIESSSGNTGIGLALAAIEFDLHFVAVVDHHAAPRQNFYYEGARRRYSLCYR
ncbi:hypothetical protein PY546_18130 [Providencia stuartii]|nr:hypothetical protein [Providencia stuartii]